MQLIGNCGIAGKRAALRANEELAKIRSGPGRTCEVCGSKFYPKPNEGLAVYLKKGACSSKCGASLGKVRAQRRKKEMEMKPSAIDKKLLDSWGGGYVHMPCIHSRKTNYY